MDLFRDTARLADTLDTAPGGRFLRVAQSDLLRLARQSVVVPELGHPEIDHAIEMIRRCRQNLDGRLFDFFKPRGGRWAINGSAGMGKSVLLAYAVTVFSTGRTLRELPRGRNDRTPLQTELAVHVNGELSLPPLGARRIAVIGLKPRQLEVLHDVWSAFLSRFKQLAGNYLPNVQPSFARWSHHLDLGQFNIVCIDEAHDLTVIDQERIAAWWREKPTDRYLVIACDRHQKLRFATADQEKWMIKGIPFAGCSTRLARNYRSPTAVYCAGLALMFRWFAPTGAKVVPEKIHLEKSFGFQVRLADRRRDGRVALTLVNDAHPANHWRYTVSRFTHTDAAFAWLDTNNLRQEDVLWVRFNEEFPEAEHDPEHIKERFNYKALNSFDPYTTIDAEIKGRDFPVVVIEGLPTGMGALPINDEVWSLRRQVYLCASRATAFLFFVFRPKKASAESILLAEELDAMLTALAAPEDPNSSSTKRWSFEFSLPESPVGMDVFLDDADLDLNGGGPSIADFAAASRSGNPSQLRETQAVDGVAQKAGASPEFLAPVGPFPIAAKAVPPPVDLPTQVVLQPTAVTSPGTQVPAPATIASPPDKTEGSRRIHEVAEALGWEARELMEYMWEFRIVPPDARSISAFLDRDTVQSLLEQLRGKQRPAQKKKPTHAEVTRTEDTETKAKDLPSPELMSLKDFQRGYGHIKDWKRTLYANYLETGKLPVHFKPNVSKEKIVHVVAPSKAGSAFTLPPSLTVQQLALYLDVKTFKLIAALTQNSGRFILPGEIVAPHELAGVCKLFNRPAPSHAQLVQLASIPSAPVPRGSAH